MSPEMEGNPMADGLHGDAMTCAEALELMPFLSDEEGSESWERVQAHVLGCSPCRAELDSLEQSRDALAMAAAWRRAHESGAQAEAAECPIDLWPGVALALAEAGGARTPADRPGIIPEEESARVRALRRGGRRTLGSILTLALAASFLVVVGFGIAHRIEQLDRREQDAGLDRRPEAPQVADHGDLGGTGGGVGTTATGRHPAPPAGAPRTWLAASSLEQILHGLAVSLMVPADVYGGTQLLVPAQEEAGDPEAQADGAEPSRYMQRELIPVSGDVRMKF